MRLIDKYILTKFLSAFFFVVLIINSIVCVIDYGEKSDDFMNPELNVGYIISHYYINFALYITNMLSPVTVFIATVFVTARLAARTELIAVLASGISFRRLLIPYLIGASLLAGATFALTGWLIPYANKTRIQFEVDYLKSKYFFDQQDVHFKVAPHKFVYFRSYNNAAHTGYDFTMERIENGNLIEKLSGPRIEWDSLKGKWHLPSYMRHTFIGESENIENGRDMDTLLRIGPKDFESTHMLWETFTLPELQEYIDMQLARGNLNVGIYVVDKYERFTYPFAIIILTIMGVIVSARKSRQGVGMQIAVGFTLAFAFITMVRMCRSLGQAGSLDPVAAAWLPTLTFAGIAVILYKTVPR